MRRVSVDTSTNTDSAASAARTAIVTGRARRDAPRERPASMSGPTPAAASPAVPSSVAGAGSVAVGAAAASAVPGAAAVTVAVAVVAVGATRATRPLAISTASTSAKPGRATPSSAPPEAYPNANPASPISSGPPRRLPSAGQVQRPKPPIVSASAATSGISEVAWRDDSAKRGVVPSASTASNAARGRNRPTPAQYSAIRAPMPAKAPSSRTPVSDGPSTRMPIACGSAIARAFSAIPSSQGSQRPNAPRRGRQSATENSKAHAQAGTRRSLSTTEVAL